MSYLMGRSGGGKDDSTAESIGRDVSKFFSYIVQSHPKLRSLNYRDILLNKVHLHKYVDYLEKDVALQPSTLMNKIRKLTSAVNFVNFIENPHGKNQELSSQCQELTNLLQNWGKSLRKPRAKQISEQLEVSTAKVRVISMSY